MTINGNGLWKAIACFLAGLVVAMASFYVAEFRRTMTRDEVIQEIEKLRPGPPWIQDRTNVLQRLDEDRERITDMERRPPPASNLEPWLRNRFGRIDERLDAIEGRMLRFEGKR